MHVVPMVIAPQRSIALLGIGLNGWRPFKVRVILDEGEESVVGDVQRGCNTPKYNLAVFGHVKGIIKVKVYLSEIK